MDLRTYRFVEDTTYTEIAKLIGIHKNYLNTLANGAKCSAKMALRIEKALDYKVTRGDLRPDLWPAVLPQKEKTS